MRREESVVGAHRVMVRGARASISTVAACVARTAMPLWRRRTVVRFLALSPTTTIVARCRIVLEATGRHRSAIRAEGSIASPSILAANGPNLAILAYCVTSLAIIPKTMHRNDSWIPWLWLQGVAMTMRQLSVDNRLTPWQSVRIVCSPEIGRVTDRQSEQAGLCNAGAICTDHMEAGRCSSRRQRDSVRFSRRFREAGRVSQSKLAERAGFDHPMSAGWRAAHAPPTRDAVEQLAQALGLERVCSRMSFGGGRLPPARGLQPPLRRTGDHGGARPPSEQRCPAGVSRQHAAGASLARPAGQARAEG